MNPHQLKRLFPNASKAVLAANSKDYGPNHPTEPEIPHSQPAQQPRALARDGEGQARRAGRPAVCFTLRRVQLLDVDAKWGSIKDLLDGLQYAGLISGDREGEITLHVGQEKVAHYKHEETVIEIIYPSQP